MINNIFNSQKIPDYINHDIDAFNKIIRESLNTNVKLINNVIAYVLKNKGKQLRPLLCCLSARLTGTSNSKTFLSSALVEIIHIATLLHDDVVDKSDYRRGWPTIHKVWKNKVTILIGDYMFSRSLINMVDLDNIKSLRLFSKTAKRLSEGEIFQIEKSLSSEMTEETYFRMVRDKTASLFSCSCALGGLSTDCTQEEYKALYSFGEKLGTAFQIKDDLFDFIGDKKVIGKPIGFDVKKNMITLPVIHLMSKLGHAEGRKMLKKIKNNRVNPKEILHNYGSIDYTLKTLDRISNEADQELNIFPDSNEKRLLLECLNFNLNRTK